MMLPTSQISHQGKPTSYHQGKPILYIKRVIFTRILYHIGYIYDVAHIIHHMLILLRACQFTLCIYFQNMTSEYYSEYSFKYKYLSFEIWRISVID